jgi:hypothetical protein
MLALLLTTAALARVTASSTAEAPDGIKENKPKPELAFDGLLSTGWGEGAMGHGEGSWLEIEPGGTIKLESVSIWPGNLVKGARSYREFDRPRVLRVLADGKVVGEIRLEDKMQRADIELETPVDARKIRVEIVEAYEGFVYADLYIAEVGLNYTKGDTGKAVDKVEAWRAGAEGVKLQARYEEQLLAMYEQHKADFGDRPSLEFLVDAAADGPEYLRKKVSQLVPEGFRASGIVPDEKAMLAIRKLKNPNMIPGLELAALRAVGKAAKEIQEIIEIFYAYQELMGGGRRNIKPWGERGWEVGAFQCFNEPLAIESDALGNLYIADTGNNRVQLFDPSGISVKQWGLAPDVAHDWFDGYRKWYASGARASTEQGAFINPVDVEIIPGKDEQDGFAVLDAKRRLQIYDYTGQPVIGWTVGIEHDMEDKKGGDGYLAWLPKKKLLLAIIGNEGRLYSLDSEEVGRFKIEDGTPNAVEVGKDGRLYMVFGDKIVSYNGVDGFRYQTVIDSEILGEGFEDMDLTIDEEGKLWVVTDRGWIYKFKKPGKLEWKTRISEIDLEHPRLAVYQGIAYITDRDRIIKVDALQMHLDEVQAQEAAEGEKK